VLLEADQPLQFAMRLADIIGQRPADVLRTSETHIRGEIPGGVLKVQQGKTGAKLRIVIEGDLATLLLEIREYKRAIAAERKATASRWCTRWRCWSTRRARSSQPTCCATASMTPASAPA
jgi:hypothetical protein